MDHDSLPLRRQRSAHARLTSVLVTVAAAVALTVLAPSCAEPNKDHVVLGDDFDDAGPTPSFAETADGASDGDSSLVTYCPSNQCPAGHTTCPNSFFPCDVDVRTDKSNCGECGAACPHDSNVETFDCVEGRCVMTCNLMPIFLDCDGAPDDGCETRPNTNENCGGCGVQCLDPAKPCVQRHIEDFGCGCPDGLLLCPSDADNPEPHCVEHDDDENCGACGNVCDPEGGGAEHPANTKFGCLGAQCGQLKCLDGFANCDGDVSNGCEASLASDDTCGGCGRPCDPGTKCAQGLLGGPFCACPEGQTFCGVCPKICTDAGCVELGCIGTCHDLTSDVTTCGSCDVSCDEGTPFADPFCSYGSCGQRCENGRADCNGNASDGCEVETTSDPSNCGGCEITCDAVAGQACVSGRCVVAPCDQIHDDAGGAR